jgi:hypothetical protein
MHYFILTAAVAELQHKKEALFFTAAFFSYYIAKTA